MKHFITTIIKAIYALKHKSVRCMKNFKRQIGIKDSIKLLSKRQEEADEAHV